MIVGSGEPVPGSLLAGDLDVVLFVTGLAAPGPASAGELAAMLAAHVRVPIEGGWLDEST